MTRLGRLGTVVLTEGLLLVLVTACSYSWSARGSRSMGGQSTSASFTSGGAGSFASGGAAGGISMVSCTNDTCTVTLRGSNSTAHVLGTSFSIRSINSGRVTLRAGDQDVTCAAGQTVSAGSLRVQCTEVTADTVRFTVTRA